MTGSKHIFHSAVPEWDHVNMADPSTPGPGGTPTSTSQGGGQGKQPMIYICGGRDCIVVYHNDVS